MVAFPGETHGTAKHTDAAILTRAFWNRTPARDRRMIRVILHVTWYKQIQQAIVIVVPPGWSGGPTTDSYTGFLCDIGEGTVMIVVVEAILAEIGDIYVGPAVVIIVSDSHAETWRFQNRRFFRPAGTMMEFIETSLLGDIDEHNRRAVDKSACGDRASLGIFYGRVGTASGHS